MQIKSTCFNLQSDYKNYNSLIIFPHSFSRVIAPQYVLIINQLSLETPLCSVIAISSPTGLAFIFRMPEQARIDIVNLKGRLIMCSACQLFVAPLAAKRQGGVKAQSQQWAPSLSLSRSRSVLHSGTYEIECK